MTVTELKYLSFFKGFLVYYYEELSFESDKDLDFKSFNYLSGENLEIYETKVYDTLDDVKIPKVEYFYPLYLESSLEETFETLDSHLEVEDIMEDDKKNLDIFYENSSLEETFETLNSERSLNIRNIKLEAKSLEIKDLRASMVLSDADILHNFKDNLVKYEAEALKFIGIIEGIDNNTEIFYPAKAKDLFIEYLGLIPRLIGDINESLDNLLPQYLPLPEQTVEELSYLNESFINKSLPEQIENVNSLEPEDIMEDAIENLCIFSDKSSLEPEDIMEDALKNLDMFYEKD